MLSQRGVPPIYPHGASINLVDSWGGGGLAKWPLYYICLIVKVAKGEGVKIPKNIFQRRLWMAPNNIILIPWIAMHIERIKVNQIYILMKKHSQSKCYHSPKLLITLFKLFELKHILDYFLHNFGCFSKF